LEKRHGEEEKKVIEISCTHTIFPKRCLRDAQYTAAPSIREGKGKIDKMFVVGRFPPLF
jgi:hypothetical protein